MTAPVCNHGAKVPAALAEFQRRRADRVRPDWVRISFEGSEDALDQLGRVLCAAFGAQVSLVPRKSGMLGFAWSADYVGLGRSLARVAWGGESQRGRAMLEVSGVGCEIVRSWAEVIAFAEVNAGKLTRLDLALDTESVTIEQATRAYFAGEFNGRGRRPTAKLVDDLGNGTGRTLYVGRRGNDKFLRVYEKGRQLGAVGSPWVRVEVELLAKTVELPLGAIVDGEAFFAGSYKWLDGLVGAAAARPERVKRASEVVLGRALEVARQQVGGLVGFLTGRCGWSTVEVVRFLRRPASDRIVGAIVPEGWSELCEWARLDVDGWVDGSLS